MTLDKAKEPLTVQDNISGGYNHNGARLIRQKTFGFRPGESRIG